MTFDLLVRGGLVFDGTGADPVRADVGIAGGRVVSVEPSLQGSRAARTLEADGRWVVPGFLDNHTHYDAEVLLAPGLPESVRHGVTTVCMGSCSLGTVMSSPEDCADVFARVEAIPPEAVRTALERHKDWSSPAGYLDHLDARALGPNVMAYLGHSDLRVAAMGLEASVTGGRRPTSAELAQMQAWLHEGLDAGFLGLSCMTNPWDKVGGERFRSRPLPSTFATWGEYRSLHGILRARDAVLQSAPNITTKVNALLYLAESASFGVRKPLRTTLITLADAKANPALVSVVAAGTSAFLHAFGANVRWQSVPMPFEVYADGVDLVVFEEFGAGEEALHLTDQLARNTLFRDPAYRRRFRRDYDRRFGPRVWHRDLHDALIVSAPDEALVGRTFGALADAQGEHPVDTFLDLVVAHGTALRWRTTIANHRPEVLAKIVAHESVHVGFSDAGAHLRNMAFYNFPLALLRMVRDAEAAGRPIMSTGRAVHRLTGEIADWFGVDAGHLRPGDRADVAIVDPNGLDEAIAGYHEAVVPFFGGLSRMVRRNDRALRTTVIGGRVAFHEGQFVDGFGVEGGHGRVLRRGVKVEPRTVQAKTTATATAATR